MDGRILNSSPRSVLAAVWFALVMSPRHWASVFLSVPLRHSSAAGSLNVKCVLEVECKDTFFLLYHVPLNWWACFPHAKTQLAQEALQVVLSFKIR
jgi:hypothetical protein